MLMFFSHRIKQGLMVINAAIWLLLGIALVASKAVDSEPSETFSFPAFKKLENPLADVAAKKKSFFQPLIDKKVDYQHEKHDGYWKKKLIWKPDWVKVWKPASKQIWKTAWKKYWKPIWVPTQKPVWKPISVPDWKKIWKPVWKTIQVPAWKEIKIPDWKKIWKPVWVPIKVPGWKEIKVPEWKKYYKPVWKHIEVPAWKEIQIPYWKKFWVPKWIKIHVPGSKTLEKGHDYEIIAHDLWKKKLVWEPVWKKFWKPAQKQIWVPSKKLVWKEAWKQIWRLEKKEIWTWSKKLIWKEAWKQIWKYAKKQIWVPSKKLEWKEAWKQIWRPSKKLVWVPDKKLAWKEAWKTIQVPAWKKIWVPAWKKVWKPVWISEWIIVQHHHHPPEHGWDRKDSPKELDWAESANTAEHKTLPESQKFPYPIETPRKLEAVGSQNVRFDRGLGSYAAAPGSQSCENMSLIDSCQKPLEKVKNQTFKFSQRVGVKGKQLLKNNYGLFLIRNLITLIKNHLKSSRKHGWKHKQNVSTPKPKKSKLFISKASITTVI